MIISTKIGYYAVFNNIILTICKIYIIMLNLSLCSLCIVLRIPPSCLSIFIIVKTQCWGIFISLKAPLHEPCEELLSSLSPCC